MPDATFDYVIAGGGSAGCALAARLSEDPDVTVCLLEAGPSDVGDDDILVLSEWMHLLDSGYDWDYPVEPQERGNSFMRHARAKVLGGCSSHNSCIAFLPPAEALDDWVAPIATQSSSASGGGRNAMQELCDEHPPSTLARACRMNELPRSCGSTG